MASEKQPTATVPKDAHPGKRKQPYHHGDLREALMSAALLLIHRHGIQGFSLKAAAQMAGVSTAAPYRHFADKEALIAALQQQGFSLFNAALAQAFHSGQTPQARIDEMGIAYVHFALQHPAHFRIMFGLSSLAGSRNATSPANSTASSHLNSSHPSSSHPKPHPAQPTGFSLLVQGVEELIPQASPQDRHATVLACWSLVHGYAMLQMEGAFHAMARNAEAQLRQTISLSTARIAPSA